MKQQIFGLRKTQVDQLVKQLEMEFISDQAPLQLELERLKSENRQLEIELEKRIEVIPKETVDSRVWALGKNRIERVIHYLEEKKAVEIEEIRKGHQERTSHINKQIEEMEIEIQSVEEIFADLLDQFTYQIENPGARRQSSEIEAKAAGPLIIELDSNQILSGHEAAVGIEPAVQEQDTQEFQIEEDKRNEEKAVQTAAPVHHGDSFWGDLETMANHSFTALQEESLSNNTEYDQIDKEFNKKVKVENDLSSPFQNSATEINSESKEYEKPELTDSIDRQSDALLEQIDSIKTQYIVGKVAGEDLSDLNGKVILSKNSVITRDAVERANQIGKLAELIINMKLAGSGEE